MKSEPQVQWTELLYIYESCRTMHDGWPNLRTKEIEGYNIVHEHCNNVGVRVCTLVSKSKLIKPENAVSGAFNL